MIRSKSKCWILLFLLLSIPYAKAENVYPVAEVEAQGWVNVRRDNDPSSPILGRVQKGDSFTIQSAGSNYLIMDGPYATGYIASEFVRLTNDKYPLFKSTGDEVIVRAFPGSNGRFVGSVNKNTSFAAEKSEGWYTIKTGRFRGQFISASFVAPVEAIPEAVAAPMAAPVAAPVATPAPAAEPAAVPAPAPSPVPTSPAVTPPIPGTQPPGWNEQKEDRFNEQVAKMFKKKKNFSESAQVLMPIYFEHSASSGSSINTRIVGGGEIEIEAKEIFKILRGGVAESWFDRDDVKAITPKSEPGNFQWIKVSAFKDTGITVTYDELKLEIKIKVPPELRGQETLSLARSDDYGGLDNIETPARFSSFININATEIIDSRNTSYKDRRTPVQAQLENGTNIMNFVIEAYGNYTEDRGQLNGKESFIRQDVRVVRDLPSLTTRASVGDVLYPVQAFQVYRPMKGVSIYRQFSMSPSKITYPTGDNEVYLKSKSKVYIWVNDQLQKVVELPAGRHRLKDFQYTSGMNNVRFEIVDEFGQVEIQDHSYSANSELLKPGLHQFSYAVGSPSDTDATTGNRVYDEDNNTFSGFHRYGFNNYFTGGANAQVDSQQSMYGLEGNFSLKKGYLRMISGYSNTDTVGSGYAVAAQYIYVDQLGPKKTQRSFNAGLTYRSDMYTEFGITDAPTIARPLDLSFAYSRSLSKTLSGNVSVNYLMYKKIITDASNSFSLRVGLSNRWSSGISANVSAAHSKTNTGKDEISMLGFLIWSMPKESQTVSAYTNTADGSSRVNWSHSPSSGADSASYQANFRESEAEKGYGATASLNGNHARLAASHEVVLTKIDEPTTAKVESDEAANLTTLQMGTSLVYAKGRFGIGRPVTDSFAIIAPIKSLKGKKLLVNPDSQGNYIAKSDWLGPAVVPEVASYNPTSLIIGAKDLPLGVSIPQDHFNLYPKYKSGYAFPLGTDANVYISVTLIDSKGEPLAMEAGLATYLDDESQPPITVFTSRKGVIQSEGFRSGRYRIDIRSDKYQPVEIVIPEDAEEEYSLGTVILKDK